MNIKQLISRVGKQQETALTEVQKAVNERDAIQAELTPLLTQRSEVANAKAVIEATLVINPSDKSAQSNVSKAEAKLNELDAQIAQLQERLSKADLNIEAKQEESYLAKGEALKAETLKKETKQFTLKQLKETFEKIDRYQNDYALSGMTERIKLAEAFGYTVERNSLGKKELPQVTERKVVAHEAEVQQQASEKAREIASKVEQYARELLEAEGIELK